MPAHMRDIRLPHCSRQDCGQRATKEVYGARNNEYGKFCKKHATELVDRLNGEDERQAKDDTRAT